MTKSKREVENLKTQHNDSIEWEQAEGFSKYLISTAVSYTHLTLPTTERV